jgi:hypothetical protein
MNYELLQELISKNLSIAGISEELNCSKANIRYWLRKYSLNTNFTILNIELKNHKNGRVCKICSSTLTGHQKFFCSKKCKTKNENPNTVERQKRISRERKLELIKMSGGCCEICGYDKNYSALQFHHLNPENKTFNLDSRILSNTKWDSIIKEWEKCKLLCANCHFEIHNPENII